MTQNQIIEHVLDKRHPQWPYCVALEVGTTLYLIQHGDRYFKWSYVHRDAADMVANRVQCDYNPSNWVAEISNTCPSDTTEAEVFAGHRDKLYEWER